MPCLLRDLRTLGIALVAVAGVLSVPGTASACTAGIAAKATRSCCAGRPATACGCCGDAGRASMPTREPRVDAYRAPAPRVVPTGPCACRPEGSPAPARAPESRLVEHPTDRVSDGTINGLVVLTTAACLTSHASSPSGSTPGTPVYLRTARLLI
jgi:hypothetical protein